jgi:hypothetical protein
MNNYTKYIKYNEYFAVIKSCEMLKIDQIEDKEKECMICYDLLSLNNSPIIKLPCGCVNSIYHFNCIKKFISTGINENLCPYCRIDYIDIQYEFVIEYFNQILLFHFISNSINNLINFLFILIKFGYNESMLLSTLFLIKILSNIKSYYKSKHSISLIQKSIVSCYIYQIFLFGIIMVISNNFLLSDKLLLSINIFFIGLDFTFRYYYNNYLIDKT